MLSNGKEDCFAFIKKPTEKTKCSILITNTCLNCPFYKTREKFELDNLAAERHNRKVGARNYQQERVEKVREAAARQYERLKQAKAEEKENEKV